MSGTEPQALAIGHWMCVIDRLIAAVAQLSGLEIHDRTKVSSATLPSFATAAVCQSCGQSVGSCALTSETLQANV